MRCDDRNHRPCSIATCSSASNIKSCHLIIVPEENQPVCERENMEMMICLFTIRNLLPHFTKNDKHSFSWVYWSPLDRLQRIKYTWILSVFPGKNQRNYVACVDDGKISRVARFSIESLTQKVEVKISGTNWLRLVKANFFHFLAAFEGHYCSYEICSNIFGFISGDLGTCQIHDTQSAPQDRRTNLQNIFITASCDQRPTRIDVGEMASLLHW